MRNSIFLLLLILSISFPCSAEEYLVNAHGVECQKGLYQQPNGGPFTVWLFCDDALGSNIGVINSSGAAGPGNIPLPPSRVWENWKTNDRFWQEPNWATDITSFAWSPDLKFLYVATDSIYGNGGLYRLDLTNRNAIKLNSKAEEIFSTQITEIDLTSDTISVEEIKKTGNVLPKIKQYSLK